MKKLLICTPVGTFSVFHYMFYIFLSGCNSKTIQDIKFGAQVLKSAFSRVGLLDQRDIQQN